VALKEEALILAKYLRDERKTWVPRITVNDFCAYKEPPRKGGAGVNVQAKLGITFGDLSIQRYLKEGEDFLTVEKKGEKLMVTKKLSIGHEKLCNCPPSHLNCLTAKEWVKSQVAIWEFFYEKRDVRDKNIHPAVFPIALPAHCIKLFTHKGELVLDPFMGIGTTLVAAHDLERNAVGFDLKEEYVDFTKKRFEQSKLFETKQIAVCDDAHNIPQYLDEKTVSLCVTSPPYANMLNKPRLNKSMRGNLRNNQHYQKVQQYSNDSKDLGIMDHEEYANNLTEIYKGILPLMKPKAHCVINVNDVWWDNKRYPTHIYVVEALQKAGFELRNILIWDKRNLVNRVGIFGWPSNYIKLGATMEYILDFWRPE
jgi:DNA modification methylase